MVSSVLENPKLTTEQGQGGVTVRRYAFSYPYSSDQPPRDIVVRLNGQGSIPVDITAKRPDGRVVELYRDQLDIAEGDQPRISVSRDCAQQVIEFLRAENEELAAGLDASLIRPSSILFSVIEPGIAEHPRPLKGAYLFTVTALMLDPQAVLAAPTLFVSGHVSGLLGTDLSKRDIFTGVVIGIRWALIIGILTSIITVVVGVILGVAAAYFGGALDWLLTRLYELVYLMPVLPFLIVISAVFKPSIWTLIIIICLFFWTGPFKPVYGMALQIRTETYIEASRGLGARGGRIIFRHIVPLLLPYSFAVMALGVPAVIVYEASVSLLGLGDSSIVTWGQMLHDALAQGAVIDRLWWWVVPPGAHDRADGDVLCLPGDRAGQGPPPPAEKEMSMTPVLSVRDLKVHYLTAGGPVHAVDGLSFDLFPGETLGLVGESGCGKTTVAAALLNMPAPPGRSSGALSCWTALRSWAWGNRTPAPCAMVTDLHGVPGSNELPHSRLHHPVPHAGDPASARAPRSPVRHRGGKPPAALRRAGRASRARPGPLSPRAVRRHEAEGGHRDGALPPAPRGHPGRAHHGPGRDCPGADPQPGEGAEAPPPGSPSSSSRMTLP